MTLDLETMLLKTQKAKNDYLDKSSNKYTQSWYKDKNPGSGNFKDDIKDERMLKYVIKK